MKRESIYRELKIVKIEKYRGHLVWYGRARGNHLVVQYR